MIDNILIKKISGFGAMVLILVGCMALSGCKGGASDKCVILSNNIITTSDYYDDDMTQMIMKNNIVGSEYEKLSETEYKINFSLRFPITVHSLSNVSCNGGTDIIKWLDTE